MPTQQPRPSARPKRGILARPLDAIVFLLPLIVFYEIASLSRPERVIAFDLLRKFFQLFGHLGMWAPGLGVIIILLATHLASAEKWTVHWKHVGLMYVEAAVMAIPLLALNWAIPLSSPPPTDPSLVHEFAFGVGAGIYEELVFRLVLISVLVMLGVDLLGLNRTAVAIGAIIVSSALFAAHHHLPMGTEQFDLTRFSFRSIAGAYLAVIFWYRGYGSAAGCHAAYNAGLVAIESLAT